MSQCVRKRGMRRHCAHKFRYVRMSQYMRKRLMRMHCARKTEYDRLFSSLCIYAVLQCHVSFSSLFIYAFALVFVLCAFVLIVVHLCVYVCYAFVLVIVLYAFVPVFAIVLRLFSYLFFMRLSSSLFISLFCVFCACRRLVTLQHGDEEDSKNEYDLDTGVME